ncbi:MAG: glycoside hydrolase family 28 protein [Pirellulales bacterium]|nr:glycoside hydrolase family 28 protein [Pirellulales bacterium]
MRTLKTAIPFFVLVSFASWNVLPSLAETLSQRVDVPQEIAPVKAPFAMPQPKRPVFPKRSFDITRFGAVADGQTNNTKAIAKAIRACTSAGGGTVLVPAGTWLTGAVHLASNVNLHLAEGAVLRFSTDPKDYLPVVFTRWAGFECYNYSPLIYAHDCNNIALTGKGKIEARGKSWWKWEKRQQDSAVLLYKNQVLKGVPVEKRIYGTVEAAMRPQLFSPIGCKNVLAEGVTVAEPGPFWTFHFVYCENVIVRDLTFITVGGPNTDGANFDSCKNCLAEYCTFQTGDDCVAVKSGLNEDGWRVGRPCENIVIRHNRYLDGHGGLAIGSDMSGGVRNIYMHDCDLDGVDNAIRIKSNRGRGGFVENIWIENIRANRTNAHAIAIETNYGSWFASTGGKTPLIRNVRVKDFTCLYARRMAVRLSGLPEQPLEKISLENVSASGGRGLLCEHVKEVEMSNVQIKVEKDSPKSKRKHR